MAAVRAFINVVEEEQLVDRVAGLHDRMENSMRELKDSHPSLMRVDGRGFHWTLEFEGYDWQTWDGATSGKPIADQVAAAALDAGALIATSGEAGALLISLPLITEEPEIDRLFAALDEGITVADRAL